MPKAYTKSNIRWFALFLGWLPGWLNEIFCLTSSGKRFFQQYCEVLFVLCCDPCTSGTVFWSLWSLNQGWTMCPFQNNTRAPKPCEFTGTNVILGPKRLIGSPWPQTKLPGSSGSNRRDGDRDADEDYDADL